MSRQSRFSAGGACKRYVSVFDGWPQCGSRSLPGCSAALARLSQCCAATSIIPRSMGSAHALALRSQLSAFKRHSCAVRIAISPHSTVSGSAAILRQMPLSLSRRRSGYEPTMKPLGLSRRPAARPNSILRPTSFEGGAAVAARRAAPACPRRPIVDLAQGLSLVQVR
jgi:hypothetical protein